MPQGGIRPAQEGEGSRRSDEDGDIVEVRTHAPACTYTHTHTSNSATQPLDSHHELLEKSIEYKKSPMVRARRVEALSYPSPTSFSLSRSLRPSFRASLSSNTLRASHVRSRARARGIRVCSRDKERESSRVYTGDRRR